MSARFPRRISTSRGLQRKALQDGEQPAAAHVESVDSVVRLLQDGASATAVERYESSQALADEAGMRQAREAILSYAQQRIQAQDFAAAAQLLQGLPDGVSLKPSAPTGRGSGS